MDGFYNSKFIGIILGVSNKNLEAIKRQLIAPLKTLDSGDKAYIYHTSYEEMPQTIGQTIGNLANYKNSNENLGEGVAETIYLFCEKDMYARKHIFVIVDDYDYSNHNGLLKAIKIDVRHNFDIKFHIIGLKEETRQFAPICEERANISFVVTEIDNIGKILGGILNE